MLLGDRHVHRLSPPFDAWVTIAAPEAFVDAVDSAHTITDGAIIYFRHRTDAAWYCITDDSWDAWVRPEMLDGSPSNAVDGKVVQFDAWQGSVDPRDVPTKPGWMVDLASSAVTELPAPPAWRPGGSRVVLLPGHVLIIGASRKRPRQVSVLDLGTGEWTAYDAPFKKEASYVDGNRVFVTAGRRLVELTPRGPAPVIELPFQSYGSCVANGRMFFLDWPDRSMWELDVDAAFGDGAGAAPAPPQRSADARLEDGLISGGGACTITVRHVDADRRAAAVDQARQAVAEVEHPDEPGCEFASWVSTPVIDGDETSFTADLADIDAYPEVARQIAVRLADIADATGAVITSD